MPSFVLKTAPDRDCYVGWSTVVDAPTFIGNRREAERYLREHGEVGDGKRLDRADATGTSCMDPEYAFGSWADESLMVREVVPGFRMLPRQSLEAFVRAVVGRHLDHALKLTSPCDD